MIPPASDCAPPRTTPGVETRVPPTRPYLLFSSAVVFGGDVRPTRKTHFSQWLLISTAATTFEAIVVFGKSAADLRPLAEKAIRMASESGNIELQGLKLDLLDKMGKIQGGKHPGSDALVRARNKLGFHFDDKDAHLTSTLAALPNRRAIWLEHHRDSPYGRVPLAADVLARAFFDSVSSDQDEMVKVVDDLLRQVLDITFTVHSVLRASLMSVFRS